MLAEVTLRPQLVRHDEYDWHLHAVDYDDPLAERIMVETAMAMIDVIRVDEMSRLGGVRRRRLRGRRARPLAQPLTPLLLDGVRQPQRRGGLPRPPARE